MALHWTDGSPAQIAQRLQALVAQAPNVIHDVAVDEASRAESEMKERAGWTDRTTHARGGLFGKAEKTAAGSTIYLGGTMEYQPFLELGTKTSKPYPIIVPVADETKVTATEQVGKAIMDLLR
jgi:hypothetical protein